MSFWVAGATLVGTVGAAYISSKAASKGAEANAHAIGEANSVMADAQVRAAELIAAGQAEAAAAVIQAAKISAQAVMEAAQLSVEAQERFFAIADQKLEPFRQQGLIAQDELASMLGIPNADGELVPYDIDRLKATPGYQFFFQEGQEAVERSAAGQKLSGAQLKAQTQYGQGFAERYFGNQIGYLQNMQGIGANAANSLAQAAVNTGGNIGQTYNSMGGNLANIYSNQGLSLADIYSSGALSQAALVDSLATNQGNLALATGANRASLYDARAGIYGKAIEGVATTIGGAYDKRYGTGGVEGDLYKSFYDNPELYG